MFLFWWKRSDSWFQLKLQKAWALEVSLGVEGCFFWYQLISTLFFFVELGVSSEEAKHSQFKSIRGANGYFFPKKMSGWLSRLGCVCVLITLTTGLGTNKTRWRRGCCVEAKAMWQPRMEELSRLQAFLHTTFHGCFFWGNTESWKLFVVDLFDSDRYRLPFFREFVSSFGWILWLEVVDFFASQPLVENLIETVCFCWFGLYFQWVFQKKGH